MSPASKPRWLSHGQPRAECSRVRGSVSSSLPHRSKAQQVAAAKQALARRAEDAVALHLERAGYSIVARNLRFGHLELDIVARYADLILVVEVRTRGAGALTSAHGSVGAPKRRNLQRAAARLWSRRYRHDPSVSRLRIDVAAVVFTADGPIVDYAPAAIRR